jgi:hypothetical protein
LQNIREAFDSLPPNVIASANGFAVDNTSPLGTHPKTLSSLHPKHNERPSFNSLEDAKDGSPKISFHANIP